MFDDILTSIQRWWSNAKLKLNAYKSEHMIFRKCKIVIHGLLRLAEDGDYTEQVKVLGCYFDCQLTTYSATTGQRCLFEFLLLSP